MYIQVNIELKIEIVTLIKIYLRKTFGVVLVCHTFCTRELT